eukprot:jgi/Psemu1/250246/estExt_Genewise1Plus.C_140103
MALHLLNGRDRENDPSSSSSSSSYSSVYYYTAATIGPYAGILASSFRLGRIPTAIPWGQCADVYGRKFALVVGVLAMVVGNLLFGLAPTFAWAVAIRFVNGLLNGTMVVARTSITEIAHGDPKLEARGVAMMSSMSGYGMLIGPAIGGLLSEPVRQHPGFFLVSLGKDLLEEHPFLLPNLVGSLVAFLSLVIVVTCQQLPLSKNRSDFSGSERATASTTMTTTTTTTTSMNENTPLVQSTTPHSERTSALPLTTSTVRYYFYSMWCYAFTSLASSEAFPLFAMTSTSKGGLGLDETNIGIVQTIAGSVFVLGQYSVFMHIKKRLGVLQAVRVGALYSNLLRILIPLGLYFSPISGSDYNWCQLGYLGLISGVAEIFGSIFMGCATIGSNACIEHSSQRASMNGLQSMVASLGRGVGPIVAGYLVAFTMSSEAISPQLSGWVVYAVLVLVGMVTYLSTAIIPDEGKR